jgi:hypothetical protein
VALRDFSTSCPRCGAFSPSWRGYANGVRSFDSPRSCEGFAAPGIEHLFEMVTSAGFQVVRRALLACTDADRAFLRRWILRWVDEHGHVQRDPATLPQEGCSD